MVYCGNYNRSLSGLIITGLYRCLNLGLNIIIVIYFFKVTISSSSFPLSLSQFRYADHKRYSEYSRVPPIGGSSTPGSSSSRDYHRERDRDRDRRRDRERYGAPPPGAYYGAPAANGADLAYRYPMEGAGWSRADREYMEYRRAEYERRPPPSANS